MNKELLQNAKPILFNTEMVKAILVRRKTQTRRPIKLNIKKSNETHSLNGAVFTIDNKLYFEHNLIENFSKYKVGDILWVREPVKVTEARNDNLKMEFEYLSDGTKKIIDIPKKYLDEYDFIKNNCFLAKLNELYYDKEYVGVPSGCLKEMARIFLKVTKVKIERLQDITRKDVLSEGIREHAINQFHPHTCLFVTLWNSTAKDGYKWEDNPYVFVYEFEKVEVC
ncbi:hypothetical protein D3M61_07300 [Aliarcobacter butzleri]|uniref:hypothetical protein n=1 Tax=Aliarcobacter butzleri TaxID=28197 RepID=UPI00102E0F9F|nr:hypothetical protein [Aliarcobacter butzleri]RZV13681.1 hypothetical protein D3M61_07300 [Aliarcobacter butzleri]